MFYDRNAGTRRAASCRGGIAWAAVLLMASGLGCRDQKPPPAPRRKAPPAAKTQPSAAPKTQPSTAPKTQPRTAAKWRFLFDGETLEGWKVPEWGGSGKVYVKDGAVHMESGDTCTGFTYTGKIPREDYEIALEGKRVEGVDFFCGLTFPVGKDPMTLICGGWGGTVTGLSSIDGMDASQNDTGQYIEYKNKRWYDIRVRVTKAKITVRLDNKQIIEVEREGKKIGIRPEVEQSVPLGICTWQTHGAVRDIRIRTLSKAER